MYYANILEKSWIFIVYLYKDLPEWDSGVMDKEDNEYPTQVEAIEEYLDIVPQWDWGLINKEASEECERSVQLLLGGIAPWSRQSAGIQEYSANTPRTEQTSGEGLLLDQRADDEATEGGVWFGIGSWIAVGFLAIVGKFYFPFGSEGWVF